jgi:hypothetical protein
VRRLISCTVVLGRHFRRAVELDGPASTLTRGCLRTCGTGSRRPQDCICVRGCTGVITGPEDTCDCLYSCVENQCILDERGVELQVKRCSIAVQSNVVSDVLAQVCQAGCGPRLYRCIDGQCALSQDGGLELDVCEQICDPQPRLYRCVSGQCVESQDGGMCVATYITITMMVSVVQLKPSII